MGDLILYLTDFFNNILIIVIDICFILLHIQSTQLKIFKPAKIKFIHTHYNGACMWVSIFEKIYVNVNLMKKGAPSI